MNHRIDLADLVRRSQALAQGAAGLAVAPPGDGALREVTGFGPNPGGLRMLEFVPESLPEGAPLIVALHGCTQTAGGYDRGTGWSTLAARLGFALLAPEQRPSNNANRCFNWFEAGDTRRGAGEAASIRQMVAHMVATHRLDPKRVFVTGLSAGGAMTSVMLATYPEVFAGGAILAGLPYGAAQSVAEAFEAMAMGRPRSAQDWGALVRGASAHPGPWPRVSVWQGDVDTTVRATNAEEILKQWRAVHGLTGAPASGESRTPAHTHRIWRGPDGQPVLEQHVIAGMNHGVPIAPRLGEQPVGEAAPFILDVGLSSTEAIADFFGLGAAAVPDAPHWLDRVVAVGQDGTAHLGPAPAGTAPAEPHHAGWLGKLLGAGAGRTEGEPAREAGQDRRRRIDPGDVIRRALRATGLMDR